MDDGSVSGFTLRDLAGSALEITAASILVSDSILEQNAHYAILVEGIDAAPRDSRQLAAPERKPWYCSSRELERDHYPQRD